MSEDNKSSAPVSAPIGGIAKLAALFKTDAAKEEAGTWMPVAEGVEMRIRSQQSETARNVSKRLLSRFKAAFSVGAALSAAQNTEFEIAFCAEGLVTDWRGLTDGADTLPCTVENVRNIVTELPHLRRMVVSYSEQLENFRPDAKPAT